MATGTPFIFRLDDAFYVTSLGGQGTAPNFVSTIERLAQRTPGRDTRCRVVVGTRTSRARARLGVIDQDHAFTVRDGQHGLVHLRALDADSSRLLTPARTRT